MRILSASGIFKRGGLTITTRKPCGKLALKWALVGKGSGRWFIYINETTLTP
jgi:hypothetical protein